MRGKIWNPNNHTWAYRDGSGITTKEQKLNEELEILEFQSGEMSENEIREKYTPEMRAIKESEGEK